MSARMITLKRYFDVIVIVPLEEEFEVVLDSFDVVEELSTSRHIRFATTLPGQTTRLLLVQQSMMGRTASQEAATECLDDFDCGIVVCIGIAGALSGDLSIGDVCYTGTVCDVLDNAKIADGPKGQQTISLSPSWYNTPKDLTIPITLDRLSPNTQLSMHNGHATLRSLAKSSFPENLPEEAAKSASVSRK